MSVSRLIPCCRLAHRAALSSRVGEVALPDHQNYVKTSNSVFSTFHNVNKTHRKYTNFFVYNTKNQVIFVKNCVCCVFFVGTINYTKRQKERNTGDLCTFSANPHWQASRYPSNQCRIPHFLVRSAVHQPCDGTQLVMGDFSVAATPHFAERLEELPA